MFLQEKVGSVMVVGGGIAGIQAALDLANGGYYVYLIESSGAIGGTMAQLDRTFPTNDCSMCIISPKLVECGRHLNIHLMTLSEVEKVEGSLGRFSVTVRQKPRYVDTNRCIACGECARVCPKEVADPHNEGLCPRKAIYIKYPQAVPLKFQIDPENCNEIVKGKCSVCKDICPAGAIRFDDTEREMQVEVGSIILALGFRTFNPKGIRTWGYGIFPNIITAIQLERYLAPSGPTGGNIIRPSDGKEVKKMAFLQCVGSRDYNKASHGYCSSVCCMSAIKEALIAKDRVKDLEISIFFIDVRTHGKDYERYYELAKSKGIKFRRCRVHSLEPSAENDNLYLRYITDEGKQVKDEFDLVVLSVGMEVDPAALKLAANVGADLSREGFAVTSSFTPVDTNVPGIYACGAFSGPKDIPQSVIQASAAAAASAIPLADVRYSLSRQKEYPEEKRIGGELPRIGVFICHCGSNISGVIDLEKLGCYAAALPYVAYVEKSLFACSQDTQELIRQRIEEESLNRIVVAACTPRTHENLFKDTLKASGLNESLLEMANIRNQASWVHAEEPEAATEKAKDIVRMAVAKAGLLEPFAPVVVSVNPTALVIGGGVAGMVAALGLADQGFPVDLVERSSQLGGNARHLFMTWKNEPIQSFVDKLIMRVREHALITVHLQAQIAHVEGFVGNFRSIIEKANFAGAVNHGVAIVATGGQAYKPREGEYGYGHSQRVFTALEFGKLHLVGDERIKYGRNFVFIQCVGSRNNERPYCSRVCCTHSIQSAIALKEENPDRKIYILYRDIRSFGQREELYKKAREMGVVFINYEMHQNPGVRVLENDLRVTVWDHVLHEPFSIIADVVVLATAIVAQSDVRKVAKMYKLPVDGDGFLQEAHVKLRPVDFSIDGLFLAGLAHYPKPIEEVIAQALASVSRAVTVLSNPRIEHDSIKARVDMERCDGCSLCLDVCPYQAISLEDVPESDGKRRISVNMVRCKGCGICQATCPVEGVNVAGFTYRQLSAQVEAALME